MPITEPFEEHTERYDEWFESYEHAYASELNALERLVSEQTMGVEVGVGTGRFAAPLDIDVGIDPSREMLEVAVDRGIDVACGVAEALPLRDDSVDTVLVVTTICFVDDVPATLREARRVLRPDGRLVVGFVDRESHLGRLYQERKAENPFYRDATFESTDELLDALERAGFAHEAAVQTLFAVPDEMTSPDPVHDGTGDGSFVGLAARPDPSKD